MPTTRRRSATEKGPPLTGTFLAGKQLDERRMMSEYKVLTTHVLRLRRAMQFFARVWTRKTTPWRSRRQTLLTTSLPDQDRLTVAGKKLEKWEDLLELWRSEEKHASKVSLAAWWHGGLQVPLSMLEAALRMMCTAKHAGVCGQGWGFEISLSTRKRTGKLMHISQRPPIPLCVDLRATVWSHFFRQKRFANVGQTVHPLMTKRENDNSNEQDKLSTTVAGAIDVVPVVGS